MSDTNGRGMAWVGSSALLVLFVPVLIVLVVLGSAVPGEEERPQSPEPPVAEPVAGSRPLKTGAIPAAYVPWVLKAGALCEVIGPAVVAAQIEAESGWNPRATSPVGAQGLSQFMPGTWDSWGKDDDGNGRISPFDPGDAIMAQGRYDCALAEQIGRYKSGGIASGPTLDLTLAAYNAGPGAVQQYGGVPPYTETRAYVARIKSLIARYADVGKGKESVPEGQRLAMPLAGGPPVTSPFGMRFHPVRKVDKLHTGIDFGVPAGTPVRASAPGTVTFAGWNAAYGNRVVVSHGTMDGERISTTYNHMSSLGVAEGQNVDTGDSVGTVGSTGYSTGAHLHFEVEQDGQYVDPAPWIGR